MYNITLIPGDGIGPEITEAAIKVIESTGIKINWEVVNAGSDFIETEGTPLPDKVLESIKKNKVALKGPITTPIGTGFRSVNVTLRKELDLFACVRPAKTIKGIKSKFDNIDLVVFRENTEDLYAGIERQIDENTAESIKLITRGASEKIAKAAFEYAVKENRKKVTAITKANICKLSDGLFLEAAKKVAKDYPQIQYEELLIDNMCMQLVQYPELYDVLLLPNLYGDIISDLTAGLIGGLGIAPGANYGTDLAIFEPVHGSSPGLKGLNKANPTALILSAAMMLRHLGEVKAAKNIYNAVAKVIQKNETVTFDLGGHASTMEMAQAIIAEMQNNSVSCKS
ncbi:MAG: isocitrate dehydrogenase [Candidatus Melainabacteria bacterium RIFOXYA12_FULL_32_12]|nr:MAG: isocitrate dehydrogenase [Candidatus Melainabacteria bacterium RIFOXYA2_FULL_32_9]OGI29005.1 MAG: isocitrate dehydrogenase [Candidatus Melainabacteria bacterium RIFOXYA12_FULL_32_12]